MSYTTVCAGGQKMLAENPILFNQTVNGKCNFTDNVNVEFTQSFLDKFGTDAEELSRISRQMIAAKCPKPDNLQFFIYKGTTYWCKASEKKGKKNDKGNDTVIFMLPGDAI